jgi:putative Mn2+ efflux pump MntP
MNQNGTKIKYISLMGQYLQQKLKYWHLASFLAGILLCLLGLSLVEQAS